MTPDEVEVAFNNLKLLFFEEVATIVRKRPGVAVEAAVDIAYRRVARGIGMSRIEVARAIAIYRDRVRKVPA